MMCGETAVDCWMNFNENSLIIFSAGILDKNSEGIFERFNGIPRRIFEKKNQGESHVGILEENSGEILGWIQVFLIGNSCPGGT